MNNIMYLIIMWGAAALFLGTGIYIRGRKAPVRIWTTVKVDAVSDVPSYNKAVGKMWSFVAIPLFVFGIIELWYPAAAMLFFCLFCIGGIPGMVWWGHKIEQKYTVK